MKVEFTDIDEVCAEIRHFAQKLYLGTVRMRTHTMELETGTVQFGLWVTAIVKAGDGDWLIEFGEDCGEYYRHDPEKAKQEVLNKLKGWRKKVTTVCEECDLDLRPGKWETW